MKSTTSNVTRAPTDERVMSLLVSRPHHHCPQCHGSVERIRRRPVDRLLSLMQRVHRYRCRSQACGWEGNLRPINADAVLH